MRRLHVIPVLIVFVLFAASLHAQSNQIVDRLLAWAADPRAGAGGLGGWIVAASDDNGAVGAHGVCG